MKNKILLTVLLLTGCESLNTMNAHREEMTADTQKKLTEATAIPETNKTAHFSNTAYIGNPKKAVRYVEPLPAVFSQKIEFGGEKAPRTLSEMAERITLITKVPVRLMSDLFMQQTTSTTSTASTPANTTTAATAGLPPKPAGIPDNNLPTPTGNNGSSTTSITSTTNYDVTVMPSSYNGGVAGLLDLIATKNGVSWRYQNGAIEIYRLLTKTFKIHAIPGTSGLSATVEQSGSGATGGSGSTQAGNLGGSAGATTTSGSTAGNSSTTQSSSISSTGLDAWKDLEEGIRTILSPTGKFHISQSAGAITVTDTPEKVAQIEQLINETNTNLTEQVVLHYQVLSVDNADATRANVNWTAVFNALNKNYGVSLASMALPHAAAGSALMQAVIPTTATGTMGQLAGSQAIADILETQNHVSRVTTGSVTTLNNKPAPVQIIDEQGYVLASQAINTINVGTSTGAQQSTIVTGFSMNLLPHIIDERVLLNLSINLSTLIGLEDKVVGNTTLQLPHKDKRAFLQSISMRAGETLILTGFKRMGSSMNKTGSIMQGGGESATDNDSELVILVTPILITG